MRTRIATQPLHYRAGDEHRALNSLFELFGQTRQAIRDQGPECPNFAILITAVLNGVVWPFTAKWHKRKETGELDPECARHKFRAELAQLQQKLRPFLSVLGHLAEGDAFVRDTETARSVTHAEAKTLEQQVSPKRGPWWPAVAADRKRFLLDEGDTAGALDRPIDFALILPDPVPAKQCRAIEQQEDMVIKERCETAGLNANSRDPIGLAISGAAAGPYIVVHSMRVARVLLTLLNLRLGYWLPDPACGSRWCRALRYCFPADATHLFRKMFGRLRHDRSRVNLSDGGHIENLGVYELLRRRCKFIIAIGGEQDNEVAWQSVR